MGFNSILIVSIIEKIQDICQNKLYFVGGIVRDTLLGYKTRDIDICGSEDTLLVYEKMKKWLLIKNEKVAITYSQFNTINIDCDVIDADGGTRCASITGGAVALYQALRTLKDEGMIESIPMTEMVAAVSVGIKDGEIFLDLDYALDSTTDVDMNIVMTESGKLVEVQGTAEEQAFTRDQLNQMLDLAEKGIKEIITAQKKALGI